MRISARVDYSCRALLELALHYPSQEPLRVQDIAREQDIPLKYTVQILNQLKRIGLVRSIRGREGGYILAKTPDQIKLGQVIREMGGPLLPIADSAMKNESVFATIWKEVEKVMAKVLDKVTLSDIAKKAKDMERVINYHI